MIKFDFLRYFEMIEIDQEALLYYIQNNDIDKEELLKQIILNDIYDISVRNKYMREIYSILNYIGLEKTEDELFDLIDTLYKNR